MTQARQTRRRPSGTEPARGKREWTPPSLTRQGRVSDIVQGGGGKLSLIGGDPGEIRKPTGIE